eukprot:2151495-Amphidinium_carterae.1
MIESAVWFRDREHSCDLFPFESHGRAEPIRQKPETMFLCQVNAASCLAALAAQSAICFLEE